MPIVDYGNPLLALAQALGAGAQGYAQGGMSAMQMAYQRMMQQNQMQYRSAMAQGALARANYYDGRTADMPTQDAFRQQRLDQQGQLVDDQGRRIDAQGNLIQSQIGVNGARQNSINDSDLNSFYENLGQFQDPQMQNSLIAQRNLRDPSAPPVAPVGSQIGTRTAPQLGPPAAPGYQTPQNALPDATVPVLQGLYPAGMKSQADYDRNEATARLNQTRVPLVQSQADLENVKVADQPGQDQGRLDYWSALGGAATQNAGTNAQREADTAALGQANSELTREYHAGQLGADFLRILHPATAGPGGRPMTQAQIMQRLTALQKPMGSPTLTVGPDGKMTTIAPSTLADAPNGAVEQDYLQRLLKQYQTGGQVPDSNAPGGAFTPGQAGLIGQALQQGRAAMPGVPAQGGAWRGQGMPPAYVPGLGRVPVPPAALGPLPGFPPGLPGWPARPQAAPARLPNFGLTPQQIAAEAARRRGSVSPP